MTGINIVLRYTLLNFFLFLRALVLYPFSRLARHQLSNSYSTLIYPFYGSNYVELSELLRNDDLYVNLSPLKARKHNTSEFELVSIAALIKDYQSNTIFEIGTFDGRTTRAMALNLLDESGKIYTLNLPPDVETVSMDTDRVDINLASKVVSGERFLCTPQEKYIQQLWGDSATFDFSPYYNKIDTVFIDGPHSEEYVKNDTQRAFKLVKSSGGLIIWHDSHLFGVKDFFIKWLKEYKYPVYFIRNTTLAVLAIKEGKPIDILKH